VHESGDGPTLPTWALQQVVGYRGYSGRDANAVAEAALDPKETNSASACCNALTPLVHASDRRAPSNFGILKAGGFGKHATASFGGQGPPGRSPAGSPWIWACRSGYLARRYTVSLLSPVAEVATNFNSSPDAGGFLPKLGVRLAPAISPLIAPLHQPDK
jgi:hypothetical protein